MLTLMPLSGLQSAIKRRNSKSYDYTRRDSLSVYSSYSLPNSKTSMRRFSSYEELAPIFKMLGTQPDSRLKSRRSSITKLMRRNSSVRRDSDEAKKCQQSCDILDNQLAKIRQQLAQLKSQDLDISQRVDNLSTSVQHLCRQRPSVDSIAHNTSTKSLMAICEGPQDKSIIGEFHGDNSESEDEQSFEDYCRTTLPLIGDRRQSNSSSPFPVVDIVVSCEDDDPKKHCLLNNTSTLQHKTQSSPCLNRLHNDLTSNGSRLEKRLSVRSDSVLIVKKRTHKEPYNHTAELLLTTRDSVMSEDLLTSI